MRVVFLDMDGVCNSWGHEEASGYQGGRDFATIIPATIDHLNAIVDATGAKVVVSSSWRKKYTIGEFNAKLGALGFRGDVIGRTPELWQNGLGQRYRRGDEIALWLKYRPEVTSFVILDDETDMGAVYDRLVKSDMGVGLTRGEAEAAIWMLLNRAVADHPIPGSATMIVERDGLFAAMQDRDRRFRTSFPGGRLDPGETPREGAIREAFEETGLLVYNAEPLGRRRATSMVCECFVATQWEGELRASEEGPVLWATRQQLLEGAYPEWSAWALERFDAFRAGGSK